MRCDAMRCDAPRLETCLDQEFEFEFLFKMSVAAAAAAAKVIASGHLFEALVGGRRMKSSVYVERKPPTSCWVSCSCLLAAWLPWQGQTNTLAALGACPSPPSWYLIKERLSIDLGFPQRREGRGACHAIVHADDEWKERSVPSCLHAWAHASQTALHFPSGRIELLLSASAAAPWLGSPRSFVWPSVPQTQMCPLVEVEDCWSWVSTVWMMDDDVRPSGCMCLNCSALPPCTLYFFLFFFLAPASSASPSSSPQSVG
ncbi:hypothetical protein BC567DRAFT_238288 [Phyllosticta citribraziliensis]